MKNGIIIDSIIYFAKSIENDNNYKILIQKFAFKGYIYIISWLDYKTNIII
jgi:hypothetical protein